MWELKLACPHRNARTHYPGEEKTNGGCTKYAAAKLGDAVNRATANTPADYACPSRRLL